MARFSVTRSEGKTTGPTLTLVVAGQVDMAVSPRLWEEMRKPLAAKEPLRVVLKDVTYIDSSGIAVLVQGYKLARKSSVSFVLVEPSAAVAAVLDLANLRELFSIEDARKPPS
jgi:anti-sigma B factor antagonist